MAKQANRWSNPLLSHRQWPTHHHCLSVCRDLVMICLSTGYQTVLGMKETVKGSSLSKGLMYMNRVALTLVSFVTMPRASASCMSQIIILASLEKRFIIQVGQRMCCNNFIYFVLLLIGLARLFWGNETKSFHEYTLICIRQSSNLLFSDRREHIILCELQSRVNYLKTLFSSYFPLFPARADFLGINLSETVKRLSE